MMTGSTGSENVLIFVNISDIWIRCHDCVDMYPLGGGVKFVEDEVEQAAFGLV
jgi:hypothetical protein